MLRLTALRTDFGGHADTVGQVFENGPAHWGYATVAVLAISFLAFEYAPLLLVTVLICVLLYRRRLRAAARRWSTKRILGSAVLSFCGVLLLSWPAGVLKLGLLKNYAFFAYHAIFRAEDYGTQPAWEVWLGRVTNCR